MLEKHVESYLRKQCLNHGWLCDKFTSPSRRSVPDRLVTTPAGVFFVECKSPTGKVTSMQYKDHALRGSLGHKVSIVNSKETVDKLIQMLERKCNEY